MEQVSSSSLTLRQLIELYNRHAEQHYRRRSGQPTREHLNMRAVLDRFEKFAGTSSQPARINRHQVRAWLDQLAAEQLTRTYINSCLSRLRRFVNWSADLDYIAIDVPAQLRLVRPLAPFRTKAREAPPSAPPPLDEVASVLPFLPSLARDVIQLLKLTGARPSEILELTNAEVHIDDRGARLTPGQHKTAHHGHSRVIPISAAAVKIIERHWRPMLAADWLFPSPRRHSEQGHYSIDALRASLHRAQSKAGVARWRLYDVRRAVGRQVRRQRGLDSAQALLGHSNASTTEIYAPLDDTNSATFDLARSAQEVL